MTANRYGILEPKLNCSQICPLDKLDILLMPLVAFDDQGNRLGMGGGFMTKRWLGITRKLAKTNFDGLAHQCQHVSALPIESWDAHKTHYNPRENLPMVSKLFVYYRPSLTAN